MRESNTRKKSTPKRSRSKRGTSVEKEDSLNEKKGEDVTPTKEGDDVRHAQPSEDEMPVQSKRSKSSAIALPEDGNSNGDGSSDGNAQDNNGSVSKVAADDADIVRIEPLQDKSLVTSSDDGGSANQRNRRKSSIPQRRAGCLDEGGEATGNSSDKRKGRKSRKQGQPKRSTLQPVFGDHEQVSESEIHELMSKFESGDEDWEEDATPAKKRSRSRSKKAVPAVPLIEFPTKCVRCDLMFNNQSDIGKHMMTAHQALWTEDCPEGRTDRRALGTILKALKKLKCPNCDNTQRFIHAYMDHIEWCGREHETYTCELCNQILKSKWRKVHMRDHKNKEKKVAAEISDASMVGKNGDLLSPFRKQRNAAKRAIKHLKDVQDDALPDDDGKKTSAYDEDAVLSEPSGDEGPADTSTGGQSAKKTPRRGGNYRGYRHSETWNVPDENDYFEQVWKWHKTLWETTVFPDLFPRKIDWSEWLTQEDCEFYYPVSEESVKVCFSQINVKGSEGYRTPMMKFDRTAHGGFFAGGPVWATAWVPVPPDSPRVQYATVSCHRTMEEEHGNMEVFSGRGLIQIWDCGYLNIDSPMIDPHFTLGLAHDYGCVYDMSWCPAGCDREPPKKVDHQGKELLPRVGLLALACTDGTVRIFSVPDPRVLQEIMGGQKRVVVKPAPIFTLIPTFNEDDPSHGCCMCVDWALTGDRSLILAGYGTGHVCIYDLNNQSTLLTVGDFTGHVEIYPFHTFIAHSLTVSACEWSPTQPGFFSTGSRDKWFAVWDIRDTGDPVVREFCTPITKLCWSQVWSEPLCVQDDSFSYTNSRILSLDAASKKGDQKKVVVPGAPGCIWTIAVSNFLHTIFTGNNMGMVLGDKLDESSSTVKKKYHKKRLFFLYELVPEFEDEEDSGKTAETKPSNQSELDKSVDKFLTPAKPKSASAVGNTKKGKPVAKVKPLRLAFSQVKDSCCLHFKDNSTLQIPHGVLSDDRLFSSVLQDTLPQDDHQIFPLPAVFSISCNPNASTCSWVMSGGQAGIVRFSNVSGFLSKEARAILQEAALLSLGLTETIVPGETTD